MFKKLCLILCIFLMVGCKEKVTETPKPDTPTQEVVEPVPTEPVYVDENPVIVGLYQNGKLLTEVSAPVKNEVDIGSFDVYFTNEANVGNNSTKSNFNKYYNTYPDKEKYKIGFNVKYEMTDKSVDATILGPKDMYKTSPIFNYLYDDIHQADGAWYSHVEEKDVKDNTIYSTIKLYTGGDADKIKSPIYLTVFTYDTEDDFNEDGTYRGNSSYTITINKR